MNRLSLQLSAFALNSAGVFPVLGFVNTASASYRSKLFRLDPVDDGLSQKLIEGCIDQYKVDYLNDYDDFNKTDQPEHHIPQLLL